MLISELKFMVWTTCYFNGGIYELLIQGQLHSTMLFLVRGLVPSSWMTCSAQALNLN